MQNHQNDIFNDNDKKEEIDFLNYYLNEDSSKTDNEQVITNNQIKKDADIEVKRSNEGNERQAAGGNEHIITKNELNKTQNHTETIGLSTTRYNNILKIIHSVRASLENLETILINHETPLHLETAQNISPVLEHQDSGKIIEGIFDGEKMIGNDGKTYSVPANYASKSKMIEGDSLKLTIQTNGTFLYKQIKPAEKSTVVGILQISSDGHFFVTSDSHQWRVLKASVTYYHGEIGDEVILSVPRHGLSHWGAVENIIKK